MKHFSRNGIIGKSGEFFSCGINGHTQCELDHRYDAPFAVIRTHFGDTHVSFDAFYTCEHTTPTQAQFETLMDWCASTENLFEDVTDCWYLPWEQWRESASISNNIELKMGLKF